MKKTTQGSSQQVPWDIRIKHAPCKEDARASEKQEQVMAERYKDVIKKSRQHLGTDGLH